MKQELEYNPDNSQSESGSGIRNTTTKTQETIMKVFKGLSVQIYILTAFTVSLCLITSFGFDACLGHIQNVKADTDTLLDAYHREVEENEILWSYIENIDTFKSLDDAVKYRDDLIEQLQFLDE